MHSSKWKFADLFLQSSNLIIEESSTELIFCVICSTGGWCAIIFHVDFSILQHKIKRNIADSMPKRRLASLIERNFHCAVINPSQCHLKSKFSLSSGTVFLRFCLIDRISNQNDGNDFLLVHEFDSLRID